MDTAHLTPEEHRRWLLYLEENTHNVSIQKWARLLLYEWPADYAEPPPANDTALVCGSQARVEAMAARGAACICGRCVMDTDRTWQERHCWGYQLWNDRDLFRQEDLDGIALEVRRGMNGAIIEQRVKNG